MHLRLIDMYTANKIRDGDAQAFEELVDAYKEKVFNYCLRVTGDYQLGEEIAQEVFLRVYLNINRYDWRKASLSTWIFTITHNTCINMFCRGQRDIALDPISLREVSASAEEEYISSCRIKALNEILHSLPSEERMLVIMKSYLGFKYREIGKITGTPTGTVKSRLHAIHLKIRKMLGDEDG